jgi:hypothetical protein
MHQLKNKKDNRITKELLTENGSLNGKKQAKERGGRRGEKKE